jgi:hypothetical protein
LSVHAPQCTQASRKTRSDRYLSRSSPSLAIALSCHPSTSFPGNPIASFSFSAATYGLLAAIAPAWRIGMTGYSLSGGV